MMNTKFAKLLGTLAILVATSAQAVSISVSATATPNGGFFDYAYSFLVGEGTSTTAVDNVFLGSDDLSPLNVSIMKNSRAAPEWLFLGNDSPDSYLQFFTSTDTLANGDRLAVSFASAVAPSSTQFVVGLESATGLTTNTVTGVLAPSVIPAVPEPENIVLLAIGLVAMFGRGLRRAKRRGLVSESGRQTISMAT